MLYICYALVYIAEAFISLFYFSIKFTAKVNKITLFSIYSAFCIISFLASKICNIPLVNAVIFIISNYLILTLSYNCSIKSRLFNIFTLTVTMIVCETIVMQLQSLLYNTDLYDISHSPFHLIMLSTFSKLLYFLAVYLLSKFTIKEKSKEQILLPLFLSVLPVSSIIWMTSTYYICLVYDISDMLKIALTVCNLLILFSNIIVFYVHEQTIKTGQKYTEILLVKQKEEHSIDYYKLLKQENENLKVLTHDITKHLNSIKMLTANNNFDINNYINSIVDDFGLMNPVDYCGNSLLNLIIHRYYEVCRSADITFEVNIQNTKLEFMSEPDITALFDNLLDNSVEATKKSINKFINLSIDLRNTNFLVISITNSCIKKPLYINGHLISSKKDSDLHGIGIRSIKRVVKKYDGNIEMNYSDTEQTFTTTIIFQLRNC